MPEKYIHITPGEHIESISGYYTIEKEMHIEHGGREVLVVIGHMVIDHSCCGVGGCRYALVPGYALGPPTPGADGGAYTEVESIEDETARERISEKINSMEIVQQILF
jgi:hypothetical protein